MFSRRVGPHGAGTWDSYANNEYTYHMIKALEEKMMGSLTIAKRMEK